MLRILMIVLTSTVLLLTSLGGIAAAQGAHMALVVCAPDIADSTCIPPDPV